MMKLLLPLLLSFSQLANADDTPVQVNQSEYLVKFKTAHDTAIAFAQLATHSDALNAIEMTLKTFSLGLPQNEEDDVLADSLIKLLKQLNYDWLKAEWPSSFRGEEYFYGYCAKANLRQDEESGEQVCEHRPLVKEQICAPSTEHRDVMGRNQRWNALTQFEAHFPKKELRFLKYEVDYLRTTGYSFRVDPSVPIKRGRLDWICS